MRPVCSLSGHFDVFSFPAVPMLSSMYLYTRNLSEINCNGCCYFLRETRRKTGIGCMAVAHARMPAPQTRFGVEYSKKCIEYSAPTTTRVGWRSRWNSQKPREEKKARFNFCFCQPTTNTRSRSEAKKQRTTPTRTNCGIDVSPCIPRDTKHLQDTLGSRQIKTKNKHSAPTLQEVSQCDSNLSW